MKFDRLRLSGFKSFVDPVDLDILPGMTGIVGPNGCGKSNLLEALRWVMGETSYKSMRGSGMEDVIFSGTNARTSRNHAEVMLVLTCASATPAPMPWRPQGLCAGPRVTKALACGSTRKARKSAVIGSVKRVRLLASSTPSGRA